MGSDPGPFGLSSERYRRWWPDEWQALPTGSSWVVAGVSDVLAEVEGEIAAWREAFEEEFPPEPLTFSLTPFSSADAADDETDDDADDFGDHVAEALTAALGSDEVRAVFAAAGCHPILVVNDTDGGYETSLRCFDELNAAHPDAALAAQAREFWAAQVD